jgi:hypothetical protein
MTRAGRVECSWKSGSAARLAARTRTLTLTQTHARRLPLDGGVLETWHPEHPAELQSARRVAVTVHAVDVAAADAAEPWGAPAFDVNGDAICTLALMEVSLQPSGGVGGGDGGGGRELCVKFASNELPRSSNHGGCPFVLCVTVAARAAALVHLVSLPFFVSNKEPTRAHAVRFASRFATLRGSQSELQLAISPGGTGDLAPPPGGPHSSWRGWTTLTPMQRALAASALPLRAWPPATVPGSEQLRTARRGHPAVAAAASGGVAFKPLGVAPRGKRVHDSVTMTAARESSDEVVRRGGC